jgi:REP element-mobilizing transposase RayT
MRFLDLLADAAGRAGAEIWSYCLMPNHVRTVAVPRDEAGLSRAFRYVHRHYTGYINARMRVTGHLWQGRFSSVAMDETHLVSALRNVARNPVRARLAQRPRTGAGRARRHISPDRTITSSRWRWRSSASVILPPSWASRSTRR